jgi:hypothetical protein
MKALKWSPTVPANGPARKRSPGELGLSNAGLAWDDDALAAVVRAIREGPPMGSDVKYAKSGDVHIAYRVFGEGPRDLVLIPGTLSHADLYWEFPVNQYLLKRLTSFARLIVFDKRGQGLSDRVAEQTLRSVVAIRRPASIRSMTCRYSRERGSTTGPPGSCRPNARTPRDGRWPDAARARGPVLGRYHRAARPLDP